ncbi:sugar ABC transporter ATP-binding protein [Cupriavidus basilensis]|uniref:sugar ABC transporter ATP-binding protein n=1 Tax=Cupriavidus basilensis TaxID=68895 RepID=UPI00157AC59E|nr:sugar ABC transporter ATP-binding protein [Cupriavidus basilensis]NUA30311.1 sugar ABC transporter ATP-binding protein [Cupriavidus basilensis]
MTTTPGEERPLLSVSGLSKRFGATCALRGADLTVRPGEVHALMGENGAGKSTLVKMLVGALRPDTGTILLRGQPVAFGSVRDAIAAGVIPVYQHATVFPDLTVEQNLHAFDVARAGALHAGARLPLQCYLDTARRIGLALNPRQMVSGLSMAERQLLEIARGVARKCEVLILDEPTAALNAHEADRLFAAVARLKEEGKGIVFISHKLGEIKQVCDTITVLRDGFTVVDAAPVATMTPHEIVEAMVGPVAERPARELPVVGNTRLRVEGIACGDLLRDVTLSVGRGEIVGLAGLIGSGAIELGEVLSGSRPPGAGTIRVDELDLTAMSRRRFKQGGVGLIPADRSSDGIFPGLNCAANAVASTYASISDHLFVSDAMEVGASERLFASLRVRPGDPALDVSALSGGNQQKLLVIRNLLLPGLKVLVVIEPTRGVDVNAREAIHDALVDAARRGVCVIVASSDIDEVVALSHRIVVMRHGRMARVFARGVALQQVIACTTGATDGDDNLQPTREEAHHGLA